MRLAFADGLRHICDPRAGSVPVAELLSDEYLTARAKLIKNTASVVDAGDVSAFRQSDTGE